MKDKFRIDLSKTTARAANRTVSNPIDSNRTDVSRTGANTKPDPEDYEAVMKWTKEASLRDNVRIFLLRYFQTSKMPIHASVSIGVVRC